ncbi:hypothetical protein DFQ27_005809 [Actinomortierella ambigua]|uniref:Uncharacterized protein n=1 Tax=Actinomortierella ambigua TaxID=1343610 RepID=A0A9P6Q0E6_9FUNG|nr:hypothetical protein DFQ27_005809 [Actinomortierella ambigua]
MSMAALAPRCLSRTFTFSRILLRQPTAIAATTSSFGAHTGRSLISRYASNTSKRSPFKYSHPEAKNASVSPSSLVDGAPTSAIAGGRTKKGAALNASRQLAEMCAKEDVVMYTPPESLKKVFWIAYSAAGLQLIFWINTAQYAFTHYTDNPIFSTTQPDPPALPIPGSEGIESTEVPLAPLRKRVMISVGLVGTGLVIAFGICAVPWRYVTKMTFLKGGTTIRIQTGRTFPKGYYREYPIKDMVSRQQLVTGVGPEGRSPPKAGGSTHLLLGSEKERMSFFIDRRGSFKDPNMWDKLFYKPYN